MCAVMNTGHMCRLVPFHNRHRVLMPNWRLSEEPQMKDQTEGLFPLQVFLSSLVSVSYFYPFFHPSHHTADLSHLLSLGDLSSPYHSAPALFWFSPQFSFSLITPLFALLAPFSTHALCPLLFLSLCYVSALPPTLSLPLSLSLAHPCARLHHSLMLFPPLCLVEVEPFVGMPRRRPLSFCPCCSPEGNVTPPPLLTVLAGYHGNRKDLQSRATPLSSRPPSSSQPVLLLFLSSPFVCDQAQ